MPFALDSSPELSEISEAVNYLLANFGANIAADPNTGQITGPTGIVVAYLYKYLSVKYADSADGSVGFSNSPTNKAYYGLLNTNDSVESTNPADYIWYKVTGGFGTTNFLYYQTSGGRQVSIAIATINPTENYVQEAGTAIDLDILTSGKGRQVAYPTIYQWTLTSTPPARPTTTTTFTWSTGTYTAPSGWTTTPATNTTPGAYLWAITVPLSSSPNVATSVCDWTNTSYAIYNLAYNGTNGSSGTNGTNGLNFINAYKVQDQSLAAPTFTTPTSGATIPTGWVGTAPAVTVGQVLWYLQGQYNSSSVTINGIAANTTAWTGPIAASIFQDIRSDNWNGSNPPNAASVGTWGTAGYYISRTDGNMYANGFYARGVMKVNGNVYSGGYTTAIDANSAAGTDSGIVAYSNKSAGSAVVGYTDSASLCYGVLGNGLTAATRGVVANNAGGGYALDVSLGRMKILSSVLVSNLNAEFLNGNPSSAFYTAGGALGTPSSGTLTNCTFPTLNQNTTGNAATATNASQLGGLSSSAFVQVASGTTNGKYIYYVNNTGAPSNPTTRAAWILISTNDGATVYLPGYV
jgi:hypothetical protein